MRPCGALRPLMVTARRQQGVLQGGLGSMARTLGPGGAGAGREGGPRVCRKFWVREAAGDWRWHGHPRACVTLAVRTSSPQDTQSRRWRQR